MRLCGIFGPAPPEDPGRLFSFDDAVFVAVACEAEVVTDGVVGCVCKCNCCGVSNDRFGVGPIRLDEGMSYITIGA